MFPKIGIPQNGWFIMENRIKIHDLGGKNPIFGSTPIFQWVSSQFGRFFDVPTHDGSIHLGKIRKKITRRMDPIKKSHELHGSVNIPFHPDSSHGNPMGSSIGWGPRRSARGAIDKNSGGVGSSWCQKYGERLHVTSWKNEGLDVGNTSKNHPWDESDIFTYIYLENQPFM